MPTALSSDLVINEHMLTCCHTSAADMDENEQFRNVFNFNRQL